MVNLLYHFYQELDEMNATLMLKMMQLNYLSIKTRKIDMSIIYEITANLSNKCDKQRALFTGSCMLGFFLVISIYYDFVYSSPK